ncbi:MAG TPA: peptide-methionine (R)-S-oxide reductase MsrB [Candidatus Eisenbacteria bacterium]|nr:peptide-methionine (R)-S-oxide reductase MsrB [Candidatus Eisenbacteria bacterium]
MMTENRRKTAIICAAAVLAALAGWRLYRTSVDRARALPTTSATARTEEEWRVILSPLEYHVIRERGTELPFSSPLDHETRPGTYVSADCGVPLFRSEQKYDSGTGWPSFWAPIDAKAVVLVEDSDPLLGTRVEVRDAACDGHLGHVFDDGPPPTGKRYCMNGAALRFIPDEPSENLNARP